MVSHHDLMRCLERALRRAALPVAQSQGFNPRPKVVFAQALGLGIEGRREVVDLELAEPLAPAEVLERLRAAAPPGLDFNEAEAVAPGRAARVGAVRFEFDVPHDRRDAVRAALAELLSSDRRPYTRHRPDRTVEIDLRPFVLDAELNTEGTLTFRLKVTPEGSARPEEFVGVLGLDDLRLSGSVLARTDLELVPPVAPAATAPRDPSGPEAIDAIEADSPTPLTRPRQEDFNA